MDVEFCANVGDDREGRPIVSLKISCDAFELNVHVPVADVELLEQVPTRRWEDGSLKLGHSASAPAWWSCDDGKVTIHVGGADNTMWDFAIGFPVEQLASLRAEIANELRR